MGAKETGGTLNEQSIDLGFAGLRLSGQGDVVQGAALADCLLGLDKLDTVGDLEVAFGGVSQA